MSVWWSRAWMLAHLDSKAGKLAPFFVLRVLTHQQAWCQHPLKRSELTRVQQPTSALRCCHGNDLVLRSQRRGPHFQEDLSSV